MNKFLKALIAGLLCSTQIFASHSDCFRKYNVTLTNHSGGIADFKSTNGVRGASRKTELDKHQSLRLLITRRGAEVTVKAGPEGQKTSRKIKFYSKNYQNHNPSVTLNQKGFTAEGFSQKEVTFSVNIENQSGGIARIVDSCDSTGKGTNIADGKSARITVKPSGYVVILAGAEKQKSQTKIVFADQSGDKPSVTLVKRGFFTRGIQSKDLEIQAQRVPVVRYRKRFGRKMQNSKETPVQETTKRKLFRGRRRRNK
jgi:hypothetical protein